MCAGFVGEGGGVAGGGVAAPVALGVGHEAEFVLAVAVVEALDGEGAVVESRRWRGAGCRGRGWPSAGPLRVSSGRCRIGPTAPSVAAFGADLQRRRRWRA